jgi:uncharacterized membrane protein
MYLKQNKRALFWRVFAIFIAILALAMSLLRYYNLQASIFDLGVYDHLAWRFAAYNDWLPSVNGHFRPITLVYGLIYKLFPSPYILIFLQWLAIVLSGLLFYKIVQSILNTKHADIFIALFAINPLVLYQVFFDFHADHLIVLTFFAIFYLLLTHETFNLKIKLSILLLSILSWTFKEPLILSVALMGLFITIHQSKEKILGITIFITSLIFFYLVTHILFPYFRNQEVTVAIIKGDYNNLHHAFSYLGNNISEAIYTLITTPSTIFNAIFNDIGKAFYLGAVLIPFALLPLLKPIYLIPALPAIAISLLSTNPNHYAPVHHYTASVIPPLFIAFLFAYKANYKKFNKSTINLLLIAVISGSIFVSWAYSPLPLSRFFHLESIKYHYSSYIPELRNERIKKLIKQYIPNNQNITISLQNNLFYHPLLHKKNYYVFPNQIQTADYIILDTKRTKYVIDIKDEAKYDQLLKKLKNNRQQMIEEDGFYIFK